MDLVHCQSEQERIRGVGRSASGKVERVREKNTAHNVLFALIDRHRVTQTDTKSCKQTHIETWVENKT